MENFVFLTQDEYNALSAADQAKYDKAAAEAIAAFRTANPNGLTISLNIVRMGFAGKGDKIALVVKSAKYAPRSRNNDGLSAFTYTEGQIERLAASVNVVSSDALYGIIASSIEPCKLEVTVKPVIKGEKYVKADKTEGVYEVTMIRYENESLVLSDDAADYYAEIMKQIVLQSTMSAFSNRRNKAARKASAIEMPPVDATIAP